MQPRCRLWFVASCALAWSCFVAACVTPVSGPSAPSAQSQIDRAPVGCRGRYFKAAGQGAGFSGLNLMDYGNWCGKGGKGEPLDAFDACCRAHDNCYGSHGCSIFQMKCTKPCDACDDAVVACWQRARAADAARYGSADTFRYPCRNCSTATWMLGQKRRWRCNQDCRPAMYPMKKGHRCDARAPCESGARCEAGRCR